MKLLFLHGAGAPDTKNASFVLLQRLIDDVGLDHSNVSAPRLPNPHSPCAPEWVESISSHLSNLRNATTVLTHSLGGSCCLHALSSLPLIPNIKHLVLVAMPHWGKDPQWSTESFMLPARYYENLQWLDSIDLVYSVADEVVPIEHMHYYHRELSWAKTLQLDGVDHNFGQGAISTLSGLMKSYFDLA